MISKELVSSTVFELFKKAAILLPDDVKGAIREAYERETHNLAKIHLKGILDNIKVSEKRQWPLCSDTGYPMIFATVGEETSIEGGVAGFEEAVKGAVEAATRRVPLRPTVVHPFTLHNPLNNVGAHMPSIDLKFEPVDYIEITAILKGGGGEFCSGYRTLFRADGFLGVKKFILDQVILYNKRGLGCPPNILGVGIGGTSDVCMKLAKQAAVLRPIGDRHPDPEVASLEREILDMLNETGLGPMGSGGDTTVLDAHVEYAFTHLAFIPVGISVNCGCFRRATARIYGDGRVEEKPYPEWFRRGSLA
ncbi:MAG: fumarate hydratase [Candidatus Geothermarchaeales archaeon]